MKNIIRVALLALVALIFTSCQRELWEQDDLTDSKVWVASINDNYIYYCYPEEEYFIVKVGSTLQKYTMDDWSLEQSDERIEYSFSTIKDEQKNIYNVSFDTVAKSGTLKISLEDGTSVSENYLSSVEMTMMTVDKNYK